MLIKSLVPEIAYIQDRRIRARIRTKAMRLFGITWWQGFVIGVVAFIPSAILVDAFYSWRFRRVDRFEAFLVIFLLMCLAMQLCWSLMASGHVRQSVRQLLRQHGLLFCYDCGYDLTGNVSGNCPECGLSVSLPSEYDETDSDELA